MTLLLLFQSEAVIPPIILDNSADVGIGKFIPYGKDVFIGKAYSNVSSRLQTPVSIPIILKYTDGVKSYIKSDISTILPLNIRSKIMGFIESDIKSNISDYTSFDTSSRIVSESTLNKARMNKYLRTLIMSDLID